MARDITVLCCHFSIVVVLDIGTDMCTVYELRIAHVRDALHVVRPQDEVLPIEGIGDNVKGRWDQFEKKSLSEMPNAHVSASQENSALHAAQSIFCGASFIAREASLWPGENFLIVAI